MTPDTSIPLLGAFRPDNELARGPQARHSHSDYLHAVWALAEALPAGRHVLNFCKDRYRFLVGLGACLVAQKISLMPSTRTLAVLRQIQDHYPETFCLHDGEGFGELCADADARDRPAIALFPYPVDLKPGAGVTPEMPLIPSAQVAAYVFTSGSTGTPQPHAKRWGSLIGSAQAEAQALDLGTRTWALVGTVPSQHMYGFESLLMLTLQGGCSLWVGHPFYPADITAAIASVARPRMLVTSPTHLRALLAGQVDFPSVDKLLCATAPLAADVVLQAERTLGAPLYEIYGCTETGQIASRRSAQTATWRLFPRVQIEQRQGQTWAHGGHVLQPTPLADILESRDPGHFLLIGRSSDLINIAGKRNSIAHVNHALLSIPGVIDGCMFVPDAVAHPGRAAASDAAADPAISSDSTRLCAVVVAPQMNAAQILRALRKQLDPAFLPRPVILVQSLPRNPTGKLPRDALHEILRLHLQAGQVGQR